MGKYWLVYSQDTVMSMAWFLSLAWFVSKFYVEGHFPLGSERSGLQDQTGLTWKAWRQWSHLTPSWGSGSTLKSERKLTWDLLSCPPGQQLPAQWAKKISDPVFGLHGKVRSRPIHVWSMGQDQGQWPVLVYGPGSQRPSDIAGPPSGQV